MPPGCHASAAAFAPLRSHTPRALILPPALTTRYDRAIPALAIPALGTLAVGSLVSLVDTAFVGRLGAVPLAALGVNASVFPFVALMQPLNALVFVGDGVFLGLEDFGFLAKAMLASAAGAAAVLLAVVPMGWGLAGVWWGLVTLMALRAVTLGMRYGRGGLSAEADPEEER